VWGRPWSPGPAAMILALEVGTAPGTPKARLAPPPPKREEAARFPTPVEPADCISSPANTYHLKPSSLCLPNISSIF
jgi:hypothetical protein